MMKRKISLMLASMLLIGSVPTYGAVPITAAAASENVEFTDIVINIGADETEMNFVWYQNSSVPGTLLLAKAEDVKNGVMPENAARFNCTSTATKSGYYSNRVTATGLEANTEYAYQPTCGESADEIYYFTTDGEGDFSFICVGDPQLSNSSSHKTKWGNTLKFIEDSEIFDDTAFLLSAGDQVNTGSEDEYDVYLDHDFIKNMPSVVVMGNHDVSELFGQHFYQPNESTDPTTQTVAGNNSYFSYNDVLFINLNGNIEDANKIPAQREFVKTACEAYPNAKWRVVLFHQSLFSVSYQAAVQSLLDMRELYVPIFDEFGIDVVLHGHSHSYCRTYLMDGLTPMDDVSHYDDFTFSSATDTDGIVYITTNSGSGSKHYDIAYPSGILPYVAVQNQEHIANVSKVYVSDDEFSITTYRTSDSSLVDTFTIYKKAEATERLINIIGDDITADSKDAIEAARESYDALTDGQKAKVENYADLVAAEKIIADLNIESTLILNVANVPEAAASGTEFTADITAVTAKDETQMLNALNMALTYDTAKLEIVSIAVNPEIGGEGVSNGAAFGWNGGASGFAVTKEAKVIATATFKVKDTITNGESAYIGIGDNANTRLTAKLVGNPEEFIPHAYTSDKISLYVDSFDMYFISADQYKVLDPSTKILAIKTDANDTTYTFGEYNFYYSSKYGAYVAIVGNGITELNVKTMITFADGADPDVIAYNGDIMSEGNTVAGGAAMVSEMLHAPESDNFTDRMRFEADVYGTYTDGGAYVTVADAMWILYASVGLNYGS